MALSGSLTTDSYNGRYYKLAWTATQSVANNQSTISWTLSCHGGSASYYAERTLKVTLAGKTLKDKTSRVERYTGEIDSGSFKVTHGTDGTKSISGEIKAAVYYSSVNCTGSKTWTLDAIPRAATISSAADFTDEGSPVLKYSNPAGSNVSSLQACIADTSGNIIVDYRNLTKTASSYTFSFTDAERTALRKKCNTANSMSVRFYVKTEISGETYKKYTTKTLSIVNATPTLSPTVVDTDSKTIELTGDSSKLIKYFSDAKVTIGASAKKEATVSSKSCVNNGTTKTADGTFSNVTNNSFVFSVKDSRGNTASKTLTPTMVNYVKLTCNMKSVRISTEGVLSFELSGNYFNGSFGSKSNTLTVQYRYKTEGGSYGDWKTVTATKSGNTYTAAGTETGLDYKNVYVFQSRAIDEIYNGSYQSVVTTSEKKVTAKPVFDWGSGDFNFNVPVGIMGMNLMPMCSGYITSTSIEAGKYVDVDISFPFAFTTVPEIVLGLVSTSTESLVGSVSVAICARSTTGATVRFFNNSSGTRAPGCSWLATINYQN